MEEGGDHVCDSCAWFGRKISVVRERIGIEVLQRHVFVVVKFVAPEQLHPRLSPETSKGIDRKLITTQAGRFT